MKAFVFSEDVLRDRLSKSGVSQHMHDGYVLYLMYGIAPGSFLQAVLENDLREACARADEDNQRALYQHVFFLYNYAPIACWGSAEHVSAWMEQQREAAAEMFAGGEAD